MAGVRSASRFACGVCQKFSAHGSVQCGQCKKWFHGICENISEPELEIWNSIDKDFPYVCTMCRTVDGTALDYPMGIRRLAAAAATKNTDRLRAAVLRERLFKAEFDAASTKMSTTPTGRDRVASHIMGTYVENLTGDPVPTTGNGNCLFNAVSLTLQGNEKLAHILRYFTCLNMVDNWQSYFNHPQTRNVQSLSPSYEKATLDCARNGTYSSAWTIMGLCDVIKRPLRLIYPPFNGKNELAYRTFNTVFQPEELIADAQPVSIIWYAMGQFPTPGKWYAVDHFAAVLNVQERLLSPTPPPSPTMQKQSEQPPVTDNVNAVPKKRKRNSALSVKSEKIDISSPNRFECINIDVYDELNDNACVIPKKRKRSSALLVMSEEMEVRSPSRFDDIEMVECDEQDYNSLYNLSHETCMSELKQEADIDYDVRVVVGNLLETVCNSLEEISSNDELESSENLTTKYPNACSKASRPGQTLSVPDIVGLMKTCESPLGRIPNGTKNDINFVVNNFKNVQNIGKSVFPDDCGVWDTKAGTTVNLDYVVEGDALKIVYKNKDGLYCFKKTANKKGTLHVITPQPTQILSIHRYYAALKGDPKFKKKVTTVRAAPDHLSSLLTLAVVEYQGSTKPTHSKLPHGNSQTNEPYTRTDPEILRRAYERCNSKPATEVCYDMAFEDSTFAPKSSRQIHDKVSREKKKLSEHNNLLRRNNVADDVLSVLSEVHSSPFIQQVINTKNKNPSIILYTSDQIADLKSNCSGEDGSVLGVDRTFNLGKFFVTSFSYKNKKVINRKTKQYPILLGPVFIHSDADQSSYNVFFSHLRGVLGNGRFIFGSDEEKALTNALQQNFPDSTFLLCTKHLKDNIRHFLERHGSDHKDRERILDIIFGEDGIVFSNDDIQYSKHCDDLRPYFEKYPKFAIYWERFLEGKIQKHVFDPLKNGNISKLWTNNNSESMNNRIKQVADWKQHKLPEIIPKLERISNMQMLNLRRALYRDGDFQLFGPYSTFVVDSTVWHDKSFQQKEVIYQKLLASTLKPATGKPVQSKFVQSSVCDFKVPKPKETAGKKLHQRKRPQAERTTNIKHK